MLVAVPGEATKEVGVRMRGAVLGALGGTGVTHAVIAGLADDYIQYITTPEEYGQQSYEGASTVFGRSEATFLQEQLAGLAQSLKAGTPAPAPTRSTPATGWRRTGRPTTAAQRRGRSRRSRAPPAPGGRSTSRGRAARRAPIAPSTARSSARSAG
ncbi:MAG: neutral/alkaline non-lysosomal ceramidase N-terminal domain-containing protein [Solirubrobacteraceae bacterium]